MGVGVGGGMSRPSSLHSGLSLCSHRFQQTLFGSLGICSRRCETRRPFSVLMSPRSGHLCKRILETILQARPRLRPQQARVHPSREGAEKLTFRTHSSENKCTFVSGEDSFHCHQFSTSRDGDSGSPIGLPRAETPVQARPGQSVRPL